ncbi:endospore germination permease [Bacillus bombysepticus]|uniref:Spore gernimation protein n=1 Tax=Bacillus thuringiensis serovar kumamotoensis TaxID=132267 RepID=A0A9X6PSQ6_BACUK|nr:MULTISPECIES: endospore germination permease [Bacillus cereus group]MBY0015094.1 endospore germination permease [Bacillus cereus]MEC2873297.1 endospore germination permease [Bacillus cereus]OTZ77560.1 spore gernimation protein [Bacillus thuringiensis serovar kumamtoensis]
MPKNYINFLQYIFIITGSQLGIGLLQLPRLLAKRAGTDGWILLITGWILSTLSSLIIIQIMKITDKTLFQILVSYLGRWIGNFFILFICLYFSFFSFLILQRSIFFIKMCLIPETADYILMFLFSIPIYIIVQNGIPTIGRYAKLIFPINIGLFFFYGVALKEHHNWQHLLPLFNNVTSALRNTPNVLESFLGFEVAFFIYPNLKKKQFASLGIIIANTLTLAVCLVITLSCSLFFSPDEILQYNEPTLSMLKVLEFPFLEHVELYSFALFIFILSTTWMTHIYCAIYSINNLLPKKNTSRLLCLLLFSFTIIMYSLPSTINQINILQKMGLYVGIFFSYIAPLLLWVYIKGYKIFSREDDIQ